MFNLYRVMVFFWILAGLTWLGGVVSMLTDLLNLSVSYQFDVSFASVSKDNFTFWVEKLFLVKFNLIMFPSKK